MTYFTVNGTDFSDLVSGLKVGYETLVSENSGRNANGDTVIDVVNKKVKLYVVFRPTTIAEMVKFLSAIEGYVVRVSYLDPKTNTTKTITAYTGTPEPEYYSLTNKMVYKSMSLNFIEL